MFWIYLCYDRGGSWAVLRHAPAPEGVTREGLELRLLGLYEQAVDGVNAVAEVNLRLAEQARRGRWRHRNRHIQSG